MNCIGPVTPEISDFLAYADNAAGAAIREHIAACPACRERAFLLRHEQRMLQTLLHRAGCPPALTLGEHHLGLLDATSASQVNEHLRCCPACRNELADLAAFLKQLRRPVAHTASPILGSPRTILARLSPGPAADGRFPTLAPVLRAAGDHVERAPAVFSADDVLVTVDSWIERMGQPGRAIAGLVVGPVDFTGAEVSLDTNEGADQPPAAAPIDELGNFLISNVSAGAHQLLIRLPAEGLHIQIDELTVQ